jgi:hypothetical protein
VIDQLASLRKRLRQAGIGSLLPPIDRALAAHQHTALP